MGFIILGIILSACCLFITVKLDDLESLFGSLVIFLFVGGIIAGLFVNTGGYKDPVMEEQVDLISLSDSVSSEGGGLLYVCINSSNVYTYYTQIESEFAGKNKAYKSETISGENYEVIVVEEKKCENPRVIKYFKDSKATFLSFGFAAGKTYYVFYVPEGSIAREIQLN